MTPDPKPCCGRRGAEHWPTCEETKVKRDPDYYPSLEAYTADVLAARAAYRADRLVEQGICPTCEKRQRGESRECRTCRREARRA